MDKAIESIGVLEIWQIKQCPASCVSWPTAQCARCSVGTSNAPTANTNTKKVTACLFILENMENDLMLFCTPVGVNGLFDRQKTKEYGRGL